MGYGYYAERQRREQLAKMSPDQRRRQAAFETRQRDARIRLAALEAERERRETAARIEASYAAMSPEERAAYDAAQFRHEQLKTEADAKVAAELAARVQSEEFRRRDKQAESDAWVANQSAGGSTS
jgi:recombination DNA repair RAD52 pathway protein